MGRSDVRTIRAVGVTVALAAMAMGLAACGDKDGGTDGTATGGNGYQAYISCLSEHGVTLNLPQGNRPTDQPRPDPSRSPGGQGGPGGGFPGGGGFLGEQAPEGVDQATWDAARTACESVRPTAELSFRARGSRTRRWGQRALRPPRRRRVGPAKNS